MGVRVRVGVKTFSEVTVTVMELSGLCLVGFPLLFNHARGPHRYPIAVILNQ